MTHTIPTFGSGRTLMHLNTTAADKLYLSAALATQTLLAQRDQGLLSCSEYAHHLRTLHIATDKRLIADCQSGFGNPLNTYYAAQELERSGGDILLISDQQYPAHTTDAPAITTDEDYLGKLQAALDARDNPQTEVWAHLEGLPTAGLDATLAKMTWLERLPIHAIVLDHWQIADLDAIAQHGSTLPLIATGTPGTHLPDTFAATLATETEE